MGENRGPRAGCRDFRNATEEGKGAKRRYENTRASGMRPRRAASPVEASGQRGGHRTAAQPRAHVRSGKAFSNLSGQKTKNPVRKRANTGEDAQTAERTGDILLRPPRRDAAGAATRPHCPPATTAVVCVRLPADGNSSEGQWGRGGAAQCWRGVRGCSPRRTAGPRPHAPHAHMCTLSPLPRESQSLVHKTPKAKKAECPSTDERVKNQVCLDRRPVVEGSTRRTRASSEPSAPVCRVTHAGLRSQGALRTGQPRRTGVRLPEGQRGAAPGCGGRNLPAVTMAQSAHRHRGPLQTHQ